MTVLCGGGTSQPITGYTGTITLDGTSIAAYLALIGEAAAAEALAPLIAGAVLVVEDFCGTDPPADPGIDSTTVQNALNFTDPATSIAAIAQIKDWFLHSYWCKVCTCASGPAPTCGTPSSPGGVTQNPGLPVQANGTCFDNTYTVSDVSPGSGTHIQDLTTKLLPVNGAPVTVTDGIVGGFTGVHMQMWPIPTGISKVSIPWSVVAIDSGLTSLNHLSVSFCAGSSTDAGVCTLLMSADSGVSSGTNLLTEGNAFIWPSSATYYGVSSAIAHETGSTGATEQIAIEFVGTCGGPSLGCCPAPPTDPNISSRLDQIYGILTTIYSLIPVPVSTYVAGTAHSGLSGGGNITIASSTIAIQVQITELPAVYSEIAGTPNTYIDVGWLTPANNEGPTSGIPLSRSTQVFTLPPATNSIDYSLPPGETITITELQSG